MPFEYAVRPFQSRDIHGRIRLPSTPSTSTERATITWGGSAPGTVPTPKQSGVNVNCCQGTREQTGRTAAPVTISTLGGGETKSFDVSRSFEVRAKKHDKDTCEGALEKISWVNAEVKSYFADLSADIHSSDAAFMPFGAEDDSGCKSKSTFKHQI